MTFPLHISILIDKSVISVYMSRCGFVPNVFKFNVHVSIYLLIFIIYNIYLYIII